MGQRWKKATAERFAAPLEAGLPLSRIPEQLENALQAIRLSREELPNLWRVLNSA